MLKRKQCEKKFRKDEQKEREQKDRRVRLLGDLGRIWTHSLLHFYDLGNILW